MADRMKILFSSLAALVIIGTCTVVGTSRPANAAPTVVCTWTGATNTDMSVANNWSANSGQSCGGSATNSGSAVLNGAELAFPNSMPTTGSILTLDSPESVDDLVFNGGYVISGNSVLTLTPSSNSALGIDVAGGGGATILAPVDLGQSQTFAAAQFQSLYLEGTVSGGYSLTFGSSGNTGTVELTESNSYGGSSTVADGSVEIKNSQSLGAGLVTVNAGASLLEYSAGGTSVDPVNQLTILGPGSVGNSGALEDYTGGSGWAGPITLASAATIAAESNSSPFALTGSIGGSGPLAVSGSGTLELSGAASDFSGATMIDAGTTLKSEVNNALPATTALTIGSGASYDLNSFSQALSVLSGPGTITSSAVAPATLTISPSLSDSIATSISGNLGLEMAGSGSATLESPSNTYSQGTSVQSGTLQSGVANALPSGSSLYVAPSATFDLGGYDQALSLISGSGIITSTSGSPALSLSVASGVSDTWAGTLTGSLALTKDGPGTLVVASAGNSYSGPTTITSGIARIDGVVGTSSFTVAATATLEGGGTVGGVSANTGLVHPGASPGILISNGNVTLGSGTLSIDVAGSAPGSGYSQLEAGGNAVDISGATLGVSDSYAAAYGTVFVIVSAGNVTGTFANAAWGSDLVSGGRKLVLGHTANSVTLTDVTDPPQAPTSAPSAPVPPVPPMPPSGATSYSGASSDSPTGSAVATNDQTTVSAYGEGALTLSQFGSDPVGAPDIASTNEYFGVALSQGNSFSSVTIKDCNLNGGDILEWWNPSLSSGTGQWQSVSPPAVLSQGSPSCLTFVVTSSTEPSISELSDAVFAIGRGQASTTGGKGYWLVASDGGVFSFGDAQFYGSMGGKPLAKPVVGIAVTGDGEGYWLVGQDGGVFTFGKAGFYGSGAGSIQAGPVLAITASPSGKGYWLAASDGSIYSFGDAAYHSSLAGQPTSNPVVGIASTPDGKGYWLVASDGGVFSFGDAQFYGSMGGKKLNAAVVGIAYDF